MFIAANLTPESIKILKEKIPPMYSKVFYHHMTIAFNPSQIILDKYKDMVGKEIELQVIGCCNDNRAQAVMIDFSLPENEIPHITLSCIEEEKPTYSNILLKNKTNYGNIYFKLKGIVSIND